MHDISLKNCLLKKQNIIHKWRMCIESHDIVLSVLSCQRHNLNTVYLQEKGLFRSKNYLKKN